MDRDNEIELVQTIQEKDKRIKELETINENITRELLSRTEQLNEILDKRYTRVVPNAENLKDCLISVGRDIIRKADYIAQEGGEHVSSVTIHAELTPSEILNFNITKNYLANFEFKKEKQKSYYEEILEENQKAIEKMLEEE